MKIYTDGARHWGSQLPRIEEGFVELGHTITPYIDDADLIYSNNPWWDRIIKDKQNGIIKGKIILNILDIPVHLKDYDIEKLKNQLKFADGITAISEYTAKMAEKFCGVKPDVIYNPIKPVSFNSSLREKPFFKFAHIGRRYDANKRVNIAFYAIQILGYSEKDICLVGNEMGYGNYLGVLKDKDLNIVYNSVDFVLATGKIEGIGLPAIEAMACGAIPVICNDLTTREEFFPSSIFPEYLDIDPNPVNIASFIGYMTNNEDAMKEMRLRLINHFNKNLLHKFSNYAVANAIVKSYNKINERSV